jgi:CheY-like chemotaxis protein
MANPTRPIVILVSDDDLEDCMLVRDALEESRVVNDVRFVHDGEELLDYLYRRGRYENPETSPHPGIILLDLNMPRKDGREALMEIKNDPSLRKTPVVILTTSKTEEDICRSYDLGVNSYIAKPVTFEALVDAMGTLGRYWLEIVELPTENSGC